MEAHYTRNGLVSERAAVDPSIPGDDNSGVRLEGEIEHR
jgi:hypothetical protein